MNWTFWQRIVSPHLAPLQRALASMPHQTVTVVATAEIAAHRKAIGWSTQDCSPARVLFGPTDAEVEQLIESGRAPSSVHLFNGLPNVELNRRVLSRLAKTGTMVGLISEGADNRGILGLARRAKYFLDRYSEGRNLNFILAMGQLGVQWFKSAGYDSSRIFPFCYVTERPVVTSGERRQSGEHHPFRVLFLGQVISRKDGITGIRALARLPSLEWEFDVIGNGPDLSRWKREAATSGVAGRIRFLPAVGNKMIGGLLEEADLLLLPSRRDGWGAVVNEALMCGVPVVCSDNCGAADLLREPWRGSLFKAGSAKGLRDVLQGWIEQGKRDAGSSARIMEWSAAIEGRELARYLVEIVSYLQQGGKRPSPPWY